MKKYKGLDPRCGIYTITPEIARELLANPADKNRPLKKSVVRKYARRIRAGLWRLTGEPILLNEKGALLDGQHRLSACIEADKPFDTVVLYGDFKFQAMGQTLPRGGDAAIALSVPEVGGDYVAMSAIAKLCITHDRALSREASPYTQAHHSADNWTDIENWERVRWLEKNMRSLELFRRCKGVRGKSKLFALSPVSAAWFLAERSSSEDEATDWFEGLISGSGLPKNDVRLLLRQSIGNRQLKPNSRVGGMELLHWIAKAWASRADFSRVVFAVKSSEQFPFFR